MITENVHGIEEENAIEFAPGKYVIRTQDEAVRQLANQQIVGIFQGESEIGPRALGNRSILFDPTNPHAKEIVNTVQEYGERNVPLSSQLSKSLQELPSDSWFKGAESILDHVFLIEVESGLHKNYENETTFEDFHSHFMYYTTVL